MMIGFGDTLIRATGFALKVWIKGMGMGQCLCS